MEATHMLTLWPQSFALLAFFLLLLSQKGPNMVTLPILPDEFVFGYFGRLLWSLGIEPGESDFSKAVQYRLGSRERPCTKEESIGLLEPPRESWRPFGLSQVATVAV